MDEAGGTTPTVGVVGDTDGVTEAIAAAGLEPVDGGVDAVLAADPSVVIAAGERALTTVARRELSVPVVPVGAGRGVRSVPLSELPQAGQRLAAGDWQVETHPVLGIDLPDGGRTRGFFDAMLVTAEPADISEFTVTSGGEHVASFRADGLVVATSAGSTEYTRAAGGPVVTPGLDVFVVVPVAPFATSLDHWVLPVEEVAITVDRDEAPVELLVDDRSAGAVPVDVPVTLDLAGRLELVCLPESVSPYRRGAELEKL